MEWLLEFFKNLTTIGLEKYGKYYSVYRAFVIDNEDPENKGRVRLSIPDVTGLKELNTWVWPKGVFAGKGYGFHFIPQVNEVVYVEFEYGDPKRPLYSYGYPGNGDIPENYNSINQYWVITPAGHRLLFDEDENTVEIYHKDGKYIKLTESVIELNGTSNGGLVKSEETANKLNDIISVINEKVIPAIATLGFIALPIDLASSTELENGDVKH